MNKEDRLKYYSSREWNILRDLVRKRAEGICERCYEREMDQVHHLTYERFGHERLDDLQALCPGCHEFIHAKTEVDPSVKPFVPLPNGAVRIDEDKILHCPACGENSLHQGKVFVYNRSAEDSSTGLCTENQGLFCVHTQSMEGNPSHRRDGLTIEFYCEHCIDVADLPQLHRLNIWQHKGVTFVEWAH